MDDALGRVAYPLVAVAAFVFDGVEVGEGESATVAVEGLGMLEVVVACPEQRGSGRGYHALVGTTSGIGIFFDAHIAYGVQREPLNGGVDAADELLFGDACAGVVGTGIKKVDEECEDAYGFAKAAVGGEFVATGRGWQEGVLVVLLTPYGEVSFGVTNLTTEDAPYPTPEGMTAGLTQAVGNGNPPYVGTTVGDVPEEAHDAHHGVVVEGDMIGV